MRSTGRVMQPFSAHCLKTLYILSSFKKKYLNIMIMLYILAKLCEYISKVSLSYRHK